MCLLFVVTLSFLLVTTRGAPVVDLRDVDFRMTPTLKTMTDGDTEGVVETSRDSDPDLIFIDSAVTSNRLLKPEPESKPESKPEPKPEPKPETKPERNPEPKPETKPERNPEVARQRSKVKSRASHDEDDYWIASTTVEDEAKTTLHTAAKETTTLQTSLGSSLTNDNGMRAPSLLNRIGLRNKMSKHEHKLIQRVYDVVVNECVSIGAFKLECDYLYSHVLNMMKRGRAVYAYRFQGRHSPAIFTRDAEKCLDATVSVAPQNHYGQGASMGFDAASTDARGYEPQGGAFEFFTCLSKKIAYEAEKLSKIETLLAELKTEFENMCLGSFSLYCNQHFPTIVEDPIIRLHQYYGIRVTQLRFWTQSILRDCRLKPQFPHCFFQRMLLYEKQTIEKTKHVLVYKARKRKQKNNLLFTTP